MLPTSSRISAPRLRRRTSILRRGDGDRVRWVKISAHAVDSSVPGLGVVAEHDPLFALAMIAPLDTVHAAMAAQAATIRLMP